MVQEGISTALIMEDDIDWDIRLKDQLTEFALGTRILSQPLSSNHKSYADPTFPTPKESLTGSNPIEIEMNNPPAVKLPEHSPYGDNWDLLWFGHCAARFPDAERDHTARGRVILRDDPTVVQPHRYAKGFGSDDLIVQYPNHTRVIHHTAENACCLAYAITNSAARKMLYQFGIKANPNPADIMMRLWCDGLDDYKVHNCFTATPMYFEHWRSQGPASAQSDISNFGDGYIDHGYSANIRLSVKMNLERLTEDQLPYDQYPEE
jgi:hypothetical protein